MVLLAACLATLCVVVLGQLGALRGLDDRLLDLRLRHWPRDVEPMSDQIAVVAIDDKSLERIGRWPWPRTRLADCLDELRQAGARTIALDLDLSDPQGRAWDELLGRIVNGDEALAQAADERLVLAVLPTDDELTSRWLDAGGNPKVLHGLLGRLQQDPSIAVHDNLAQADANAVKATRYMLLRAAMERAIVDGAKPEALLKAAKTQAAVLEPLIENAYRRHTARGHLHGLLKHDTAREPSPADRLPLPSLLQRGGANGYVTILYRDPDGAIRRIRGCVPVAPGKGVLPLGLAAVVHHLHIDTDSIEVSKESIDLGDFSLPLEDGLLTLSWPRSPLGADWPDLHRPDASFPRFHGHLAMGEIVELASARRIAAAGRSQLKTQTAALLRAIRNTPDLEVDDWLSPELRAEIVDEIDFSLGDARSETELAPLLQDVDDDTGTLLLAMLRWRQMADAQATANRLIAQGEALLSKAVDDKLVFLGWTATGALADFVPTAAGPRTPGVLVHAALADMVLQRRTLSELPAASPAIITAVLGLLAGLITAWASPWAATLGVLLLIAGWFGVDLAFFSSGVLLPAAAPMVAIGASWAAGTGTRAVREQQGRAQITRQFRARVPGALVDELARNPESVSMTGQCREVSVLFADLAGFTTASERMGPEATVALLNWCMRDLTAQLTEHSAYVNKFLGDGLLAFWSAFHPQVDQADLACRAALACCKAIEAINADRPGETPLRARIGIATGEAIVGDCGAPPLLNDYTVIGDTANLASRLESANKQFGTTVLVDARTIACLVDTDAIVHLPLGPVGVVGRAAAVHMHELRVVPASSHEQHAWERLEDAMNRNALADVGLALDALQEAGVPDSRLALWRTHVEGGGGPMLRLTEK
jgi:class 3 adenylate cyclase/CHASE2 domain-containing sensor protein